jgi:hypothetical protein
VANVITTVLNLDATKLRSGLKGAQTTIKETDGIVNKAKAGWASMWSSFTSSPLAIAGATAAVGAFAAKAINDASALEESVNAVNVAYGNAAGGVHALGAESAESFGLSERAFNQFSVQFSAFAEKIATASGRQIAPVLDEVTTRIADFASVNDLELGESARIVQSALAGETEAIRRFGVDVSAAAVTQQALSSGLAETSSEITEQDKILARYQLIMEQTAKTAGDFERTQDSLANQQRVLSANLENLSASFGSTLVPVVADATGILNNLINVYNDLNRIANDVAPGGGEGPVGRLTQTWQDSITPGAQFGQALDGINRGLGWLDEQLGGVEGSAGAFRLVLANLTTSAVAGGDAIDALGNEVTDLGPRWAASTIPLEAATGAFAEMQSEADRAADAVEDSGDAAKDAERDFNVFEDGLRKAADTVDFLTSELNKLDEDLGELDALAAIEEQFKRIADTEDLEEQQTEIRRLIGLVGDYVGELENIPPEKVSEIIAVLRSGDVEAIKTLMDDLTKDRFINVSIVPKQSAFESLNAVFQSGAAPTAPTFVNPNPSPVPVDMSTKIYNFPVGSTPTTVNQDLQTYYNRNGVR